jgi:hypothetical protein
MLGWEGIAVYHGLWLSRLRLSGGDAVGLGLDMICLLPVRTDHFLARIEGVQ